MKLKLPIIIKKNMAVLIIMVLIPLANSFFDASIAVVGTYLKWYDRLEYILAEKEEGNLEIEVRPIMTTNKYVALYGLSDLLDDKNDWPNTSIASYFGINSIKIKDEVFVGKSLWLDKRKKIRQLFKSPWKIIKRIYEIK